MKRKQACAQGAGRLPTGQGVVVCWYDQYYLSMIYVQLMDKQKGDTKRSDGRQDKKRVETELKNKTSSPMCSWWAKAIKRDQKEGRKEGLNYNNK